MPPLYKVRYIWRNPSSGPINRTTWSLKSDCCDLWFQPWLHIIITWGNINKNNTDARAPSHPPQWSLNVALDKAVKAPVWVFFQRPPRTFWCVAGLQTTYIKKKLYISNSEQLTSIWVESEVFLPFLRRGQLDCANDKTKTDEERRESDVCKDPKIPTEII